MQVRHVFRLILAVAALAACHAIAQQYPSKSIRIIIAIAAGSPSDVVVRAAGAQLHASLGQSLAIENRPGGDMVIGAAACAKASPDGYTFCVLPGAAVSTNPYIFSRLSYDPDKDFKPVTALWFLVHGMFVTASLPVNSLRELQALASANPGSLNSGTMGAGGADHHRRWLNDQ